jgi:hypothetical protein
MKYGGVVVYLQAFLTLAIDGVVVRFTLRPLYSRWILPPPPQLDRKLGGFQSRPGRGGGEKNPSLCRELNPGRLARSLIEYEIRTIIIKLEIVT